MKRARMGLEEWVAPRVRLVAAHERRMAVRELDQQRFAEARTWGKSMRNATREARLRHDGHWPTAG